MREASANHRSLGEGGFGPLEKSTPAYWLACTRITDRVAYKQYTDRVPDIIKKQGGKVLARGGRHRIMEGPENFHRFVVIEFSTLEQAVASFESLDCQDVSTFRRNGGRIVENVIVKGRDATK